MYRTSPNVTKILGTANQVTASKPTGTVTLSLPQSIGTGSAPSFAGLTLTSDLTLSTHNLITDTSTGTKIGTATNQKLGFFNSAPIVQPSGNALTALSNLGLVATPTLLSSDVGLGSVTNDAQTKAAIVSNTAPTAGQILIGNAGNTAYAKNTVSGSGATITLSSAGVLTISAIANGSLTNSTITIAGTSTALGNSITLDTISGVSSNGFLKRTGANTWTNDSSTYLTGNQTITLTGDVTGSGTTAITTTVANIPTATTMAGYLATTAIVAPGTPAAGIGRIYIDSTSKNISVKDDAGVIKHGVQTKASVASNFLTAISDAGVVSAAQPAFTDISGTATTGQIPNLGGNPTASVGLAATNGSATTYLRSDGAPALDQTIAPTWTGQHSYNISRTVASGASAVLDDINLATTASNTTTISGTTTIATAKGFNKVSYYRPTYNTSGAGVTVTNAATLYIENAPLAGSSVTITNGYALWANAGAVRIDGTIELGNATDTTLSRASAGQLAVEGVNVVMSGGALGTPSSGTLTNCTFPTLNQNTTGSAASLSIASQTGLLTFTGLASTNRAKTVRDAADTILELGGSYTPTGTWTSLTMVTPVLGTPTSGNLTNCTFPTLNQNTTGSAASLSVAGQTGLITLTGTTSTNRAKTVRDAADTLLELGGSYSPTGIWTFSPTLRSSGAAAYYVINIPADTGQTAATESIGLKTVTATRTWATTGTVSLQRENYLAGPTYASASASQTFTDACTLYIDKPVAGTNAIFTRGHSLVIVDSTSAASSITGGLVIATTLGTTATSVGIGGGNINAGGTITGSNLSGTNTGDQTTITGNAGTATALQTPRSIYGNSFDGTAALAQIIASTFGGTGNGFIKFSGPTTSEKTKTLRDATDTILELGGSYTPTGTWTSLTMVTPVLGTPTSGTLTNCTFPTLNQNTTGSAASLSISGQTALLTFTGLVSTNRIKTVRDAADTILELGGSYTPTGTWTSLTMVTPVLGTPTSGTLTNCTGYTEAHLSFTDITTNNFTTSQHGFVPKGTNVGNFLKDDGTWAAPAGSGDMILASTQTVTGAKTFNSGKFILAGATSGTITLNAFATAGSNTITLPAITDTLVGVANTVSLTNKFITPRTASTASSTTPTPNADTTDIYILTALAAGATFGAPTGSPVDGQILELRILDNATAQTLAFNAIYRFTNVATPTTTTISTTMYLTFQYNAADTKWDCLGTSDSIGVYNATTGFQIGGAAASGKILIGNGTNFIASTPTYPNTSPATGKILVSDGTNIVASTPTYPNTSPTSGKVLVSDGTNIVASTPTFPNASATSRKIIVSDGTNWTASTETWATPGAAGAILQSDGTNWTSVDAAEYTNIFKVTGSDFTTTSTTLVDITGLVTGTLVNSQLYEFKAVLYTASSSTAGFSLGVHGAGTGTAATAFASGHATLAAATGTAIGVNAVDTKTASMNTVATNGTAILRGYFTATSTGTATMSIQIAKTTSGTATVKIGSYVVIRKAS